ncbi:MULTISPECIES: hypothetical protein [unclassified Microbacterium]|uniref:hypothetical protein n=1 Tax=unclassified Microbacterium TaxID=2609290 RepID=UPI000C54FC94|nr:MULTISPECIES: hypothetical protein [unclassified Microbacterium]MBU21340.1 hypothetical protein [Microbacterium sp.]HBU41879.1 hypothetical protein [Microbacterium sp.]|tara:strand:- start:219 stop:767 length:549 start_codon:yes stop_codon:yes gene_type:complete
MSAEQDARRAEWARAAAEREAAQKAAQSRKEQLVGELRSIANGSSTSWETTTRVKNISGEFFKAGYAGKGINEVLKQRHDEAKAEYFRKVEAARKREEEKRDRARREMEHQLYVLERIAHADVRTDRWNAWKEASDKFFKIGYPGKDAKADLMNRFGKLRDDLGRGLERDRAHKAAQRKSRW